MILEYIYIWYCLQWTDGQNVNYNAIYSKCEFTHIFWACIIFIDSAINTLLKSSLRCGQLHMHVYMTTLLIGYGINYYHFFFLYTEKDSLYILSSKNQPMTYQSSLKTFQTEIIIFFY